MISQIIACLTFINAAFAVNLNFVEDGGRYTEKIIFSKNDTTIEYDVPKHGKVGGARYLVDYRSGYKVMKNDEEKRCYVMDLQRNEPRPHDVKLGLFMTNGTFPTKYSIENNNILPLYEMDRSQLSQAILKFCAGYTIIKTISAENVTQIEREASNYFHVARRSKRNLPEDFPICNYNQWLTTFNNCGQSPATKIIRCRLRHRSCIYLVQCTYSVQQWRWICPASHIYNRSFCCDFFCRT